MIITEIQTEGFRNLTGTLTSSSGINILVGDNAQGKTNWLEAIYLLGNTKSFRTATLREALHQGENSVTNARLRGHVIREGLDKQLQIELGENSKSFYVNGKRETVTRYLGNLDVMIFSADEMAIIRGEPAERRRFLDRGVVALTPAYLRVLADYNRVLKQKNVLLKEAQESTRRLKYLDQLEAWNEQLVLYAGQIFVGRRDYTAKLSQALRNRLFSERPITIHYRSCLASHDLNDETASAEQYCQLLAARLKLRLENEISAGYALVGPHRDELEVLVAAREVSKFGSAGEQRSALITLDLAQISVYYSVFEEYPVFLIDDIDAELDARRISLLLDYLADRMQVFISTSKRDIAARYQSQAICRFIKQGRVVTGELLEQPTISAAAMSEITSDRNFADDNFADDDFATAEASGSENDGKYRAPF